MYARIIQALNPAIEDYEQRIKRVFDAHPEAKLFRGLPGAGPGCTDPGLRHRPLSLCGGTQRAELHRHCPVTKSSGKSKSLVYARAACPKFDRRPFTSLAVSSVTNCQWASNYVQYDTAKGKKYHTIISWVLAYKWIRTPR